MNMYISTSIRSGGNVVTNAAKAFLISHGSHGVSFQSTWVTDGQFFPQTLMIRWLYLVNMHQIYPNRSPDTMKIPLISAGWLEMSPIGLMLNPPCLLLFHVMTPAKYHIVKFIPWPQTSHAIPLRWGTLRSSVFFRSCRRPAKSWGWVSGNFGSRRFVRWYSIYSHTFTILVGGLEH